MHNPVLCHNIQILYTAGSVMINQMYIYGNSLQSNVVAVVVPHAESLQKWWREHHHDSEGTCKYHSYSIITNLTL